MMPPAPLFEFGKTIGSIAFAGGCWIAQEVTPQIPGVPPWLTALGFPVAMLVAVIYALVSTNKSLASSQAGRLADKDYAIQALKEDARLAADSRERLIRATDAQTAEFKRLADNLASRPCQK